MKESFITTMFITSVLAQYFRSEFATQFYKQETPISESFCFISSIMSGPWEPGNESRSGRDFRRSGEKKQAADRVDVILPVHDNVYTKKNKSSPNTLVLDRWLSQSFLLTDVRAENPNGNPFQFASRVKCRKKDTANGIDDVG